MINESPIHVRGILHVLQFAKYSPAEFGGIERVVRELLVELSRSCPKISIECYCYSKHAPARGGVSGVTLRQHRTTVVVASAPISLQMLRAWWSDRRRPDIVHLHLPNPWAALLVLALPTTAAIMVSLHATSTRRSILQGLHNALTRRILERADAIVVSARANARSAQLAPYINKVMIVPYGIDASRIDGPQVTSQCVIAEPCQVLFVGRFVYYKGLDTLLAAAPHINGKLVLLGNGPLLKRLQLEVAKQNLANKVRFVQGASDATLAQYLRACSVLVLPSSSPSESFGISVIEAMASGKPVVVSNLGTGLDEIVRESNSGLIVPPRDSHALAQAVNHLLADPAARSRLGSAGRRAFEQNYTSARMASCFMRAYEAIQKPVRTSVEPL